MTETASPFSTIEQALAELRAGRMVVVCDDEDRENEGDLVLAAQFATPDAINFMARHGRGLICLAITPERCRALGLELMAPDGDCAFGTAFTVSIEARDGVSTGISAHDRAHTVQVAINPSSTAVDVVQPGHMFPLRAKPGGVLERTGQTEAAVDLARLAGLNPAGVICEIMSDDGTMARRDELSSFCARHGLRMITVADLVAHRRRTERLVERIAGARMPTHAGDFRIVGYREPATGAEHVALVRGELAGAGELLVRLHSACLTGDVFGSARCDCGDQLRDALEQIEQEGRGVVIYLDQEGRGIGLLNKLRAYELQDAGCDTVDANLKLGLPVDRRDYTAAAQILADLGVGSVRLLTNNPDKVRGLQDGGTRVCAQVPTRHAANVHNHEYLRTKVERLGHLPGEELELPAVTSITRGRRHRGASRVELSLAPSWWEEPERLASAGGADQPAG